MRALDVMGYEGEDRALLLCDTWAAVANVNRPGVSGGSGRCLYPVEVRRFRAA